MSELGTLSLVLPPGQANGTSGPGRPAPVAGIPAFLALLEAMTVGDGAVPGLPTTGVGFAEPSRPKMGGNGGEAVLPEPAAGERAEPGVLPAAALAAAIADDGAKMSDPLPSGSAAPTPADELDGPLPGSVLPTAPTVSDAAATTAHAPSPIAVEADRSILPAGQPPQQPDGRHVVRSGDLPSNQPDARAGAGGERAAEPARGSGNGIAEATRALPGRGDSGAAPASSLMGAGADAGSTGAPRLELVSTALAAVQEIGGNGAELRLALPVQPMPAQAAAEPPAAAANAARLALPAVATEIVAQARNGHRQFEIRLEPPELGRIEVRLDFRQDGSMTAKLVVDRPETLDMLARDARILEKTLQAGGLKLSDGAVHYQLRDHSGGGRNDPAPFEATSSADEGDRNDEEPPDTGPPELAWRAVERGGVDLRV